MRFICIHAITLGGDDEKKEGGWVARDCAVAEENESSEK